MYSKERTYKIEKKDRNFIPAGINEDVQLKSAKVTKSPMGNTFLEITFEKNGAILTDTEYEPAMGTYTTTEAELQQKEDNQFSRMMQILLCFYKDEDLVFNGESFNDFANWVADKLNAADKSILLRVKCVFNNKGYITLPSYAKYTFIEPMKLPEGKNSIIVELGIDKFVRPVVEDKEETVTNISSDYATDTLKDPMSANSELPF